MALNMWAVLAGGVLAMIIGALWYSPLLFAKSWQMASGMTEDKIKEAQKKGMGKTYLAAFLAAIVLSYVLAAAVALAAMAMGVPSTFGLGSQVGAWLWLGFIAVPFLNMVFWERKSWKLYWINSLNYLITLVLVGGLLGSWK